MGGVREGLRPSLNPPIIRLNEEGAPTVTRAPSCGEAFHWHWGATSRIPHEAPKVKDALVMGYMGWLGA